MKLLIENHYGVGQLEVLTENDEKYGRRVFLEGPMVMCNAKNRNGRKYDKETVGIPSVQRYNEEYIKDGRAIGEVEHPEYPFPKLKEAATIIHEPLKWVNNDAVGKALVLNNVHGAILKSLIEGGYRLGVSTRGLGDVDSRSNVKPGYVITAVDTVDRPSGQTCYVDAIMESTEWVEQDGTWIPKHLKGQEVDKIVRENSDDSEFLRRFKLALERLS